MLGNDELTYVVVVVRLVVVAAFDGDEEPVLLQEYLLEDWIGGEGMAGERQFGLTACEEIEKWR